MEHELDFAVKYPFTESAKKILEGVELTDRVVGLAIERIKKALKGDKTARMLLHNTDKVEELASFAASRIILGYMRNNFFTNSFAVNESKKVRAFLDRESKEIVDEVGARFGIRTVEENGKTLISLPVYVKYSPRSPHYKLINRKLIEGKVEIGYSEKKRLIEEAFKRYLEKVPLVKNPPPLIKKAKSELLAELPKTDTKINSAVKEGDYPPCILNLLDGLKKHQNLPHHARWFLATYLLKSGMKESKIILLFSNAPDYSEKVTTYQVKQIAQKGYSVPSCATVMTYGLCCAVCRIGTPLRWHELSEARKKMIKGEKREKGEKGKEEI